MPVSLNNNESEQFQPREENTTSKQRLQVKTTVKMVDDALIQLHSAKGVTLKDIYKYILNTYTLHTLTPARVNLIKKHLKTLMESEVIKNKTGRGLSGHIKLVNKEKYVNNLKAIDKQRLKARKTKNTVDKVDTKVVTKTLQEKSLTINTKSNNKRVKRKIKKPLIDSRQPTPVVPRQTTPVRANDTNRQINISMFDTPGVFPLHQHSTPCVEANIVPQAPDIRAKTSRKRLLHPHNEEVHGTPRTSLPGKKRKVQKRI